MKRFYWVFLLSLCVIFANGPFEAIAQEGTQTEAERMKALEDMFDSEYQEEDYYRTDRLLLTVATKTEMTMEEAPSIVSVITGEEIRNMGARDITDVLRTVPGFDITHLITGPASKINVRGMGSWSNNKVQILINGHHMDVLNGSPFFHIDLIPLANIRQIEIIRGPGSALYGTGAFIGVVNVVTKEGGDDSSSISVEGGSYDTINSYGEFSYENKSAKIYLYADHHSTDGYDGTIESDAATDPPMFGSAAPGKITNDSKHHTFQTKIGYKDFFFSGFFQKLDTNAPLSPFKALTDGNDYDQLYGFGEFGYNPEIADKGNLLIRAFYDYAEFDQRIELFSEETIELPMYIGFPPGEELSAMMLTKTSRLGGEISGDYEVYPGIQIASGVSYAHLRRFGQKTYANYNFTFSDLEVDGTVYPAFPKLYFPMTDISEQANINRDSSRNIYAAYGQGLFDLKNLLSLETGVNALSFTAGLRHDYYDDIGSATNPRFGMVYAPTEKLWFKALYGTAFRAPTSSELYTTTGVGNEDLKPEKVSTAEGLVGYNFTRNLTGSVTYFNVRSKDLIQQIGGNWQNVGKMESSGVEAELRTTFGKHKYAYCNFTYQDVKNTTHQTITSDGQSYTHGDFHPGGVPEFYGNIGVNYDVSEYMIANVSLNYVGERERSEEKIWDGEEFVRKDQRDPIKARTLVNASLTFRNFFKGMEIQLSGFNLFDEDHRVPDPTRSLYYDMPRMGRSFMGRVSYSF